MSTKHIKVAVKDEVSLFLHGTNITLVGRVTKVVIVTMTGQIIEDNPKTKARGLFSLLSRDSVPSRRLKTMKFQ